MLTHVEGELRKSLTTAFVTTDYSYVPFTSDTDLELYFLPHKKLIDIYEKNAPGKNYLATGIPTRAAMRACEPKKEARAALGLSADAPIVLLMTGSMGYGDLPPLINALLVKSSAAQLVVMCGTNDKLRSALRAEYPNERWVKTVAYTDRVGLYLDAADVLLSKPGGLSSTEAAVKEIPLVHITPLPGWEQDNVRFFGELGLSLSADSPEAMADAAIHLLTDEKAAAEMTRRQRGEINKRAADDVLAAMKAAEP